MKTQIIITILAVFVYLSANSATISISKKNSDDPSDVCNNSIYYYVTTISGAPSGYKVSWIIGKGSAEEQNTSEAKVKWTATSAADGYIGTIKVQLKDANNNVIATSNEITVTIKSILHLEPTLTPYTNGNIFAIAPCNSGQVLLEVTKLNIPGTGTLNPEKIYNYMWTLPAGWSANGVTSTGSNEIPGGSYITASYPASSTSGTIKVKGYDAILGCDATPQSSKYATATINRNVTLSLIANKSSFRCGDTNPITYTLTADPALPCASYYWNNSPTSTTSNIFQKVPGQGNETVTVNVIYGSQSVMKPITIPVKSFEGMNYYITGSDNICPNNTESYVINGVPAEYPVNWTCSGNLEKLTQNHNTASFKMLSAGVGTVYATITTLCGESLSLAKSTWSGNPPTPSIQSSNICGNTPIDIYAFSSLQTVTYNWTVTGGTILNGQGSDWISVEPKCNWDKITVRLQTQNGCGLSSVVTKYITIDCSGITPPQIIITPNP